MLWTLVGIRLLVPITIESDFSVIPDFSLEYKNDESSFGESFEELYGDNVFLCIDHHLSNREYAENLLYNGGLKIYATMDPKIQKTAESFYENEKNFPTASGDNKLQSAIIVTDHKTGKLKAVVGGRGEKTNNRV